MASAESNNTITDVSWGVYRSEKDVHVIPETSYNNPMRPHVFESSCPCHPSVDEDSVIVHNMIH